MQYKTNNYIKGSKLMSPSLSSIPNRYLDLLNPTYPSGKEIETITHNLLRCSNLNDKN